MRTESVRVSSYGDAMHPNQQRDLVNHHRRELLDLAEASRLAAVSSGSRGPRTPVGRAPRHLAAAVRQRVATGLRPRATGDQEWSAPPETGTVATAVPASARLAVALHALGVGPVEGQAGEELGGHAAALAGVVAAARGAGAGRLAARAAR